MATLFTRIIRGDLPGRFVWRDDVCVAFMSIGPLTPGHTLVVPRREVAHWIDLDDDEAAHLVGVARAIGAAQATAFPCDRVGLVVAGYEVPHTHVHVFPTTSMDDFDFANAGRDDTGSDAALDEAAETLLTALRAAGHDQVPPTPS